MIDTLLSTPTNQDLAELSPLVGLAEPVLCACQHREIRKRIETPSQDAPRFGPFPTQDLPLIGAELLEKAALEYYREIETRAHYMQIVPESFRRRKLLCETAFILVALVKTLARLPGCDCEQSEFNVAGCLLISP